MIKISNLLLAVCLMGWLSAFYSCVPVRKMDQQASLAEKYKSEKIACSEELQSTISKLNDSDARAGRLANENKKLKVDTSEMGVRHRRFERLNNELQSTYDQLQTQSQQLVNASSKELQKLNGELALRQSELAMKEMALEEMESALNEKEENVDILSKNLAERESRVAELEEMIREKELAVSGLKTKISDALIGFTDAELSVTMKDGKVYVSIAENLLFASGSTQIDPKGKAALNTLAAVLNKQHGISIMVEGHTDNVPYSSKTGAIKDNWDLSVLRATSVVKILTMNNALSADRIMAAGRGESFPVAENTTAAGRAKNRRTEIILSPDLKEIFDILESN